jgi:hypothetical protein
MKKYLFYLLSLIVFAISFESQAQIMKDLQVTGGLKLPNQSFSKALYIDGAGQIKSSSLVDSTELDRLDGLDANIMTKLSGKVDGQSSSVDSEVALFSGTGGETIKRATGTGFAKLTSGVLSTSSTVNAASELTGLASLANGGTNKSITASAGQIVYTDGDSFEVLAAGTSGQVLQSNGAAAPSWATFSNTTKPCRVDFGGASEPSVCSSSPCTEYLDSCSAASTATRSATGTYATTFAAGTWANSSYVFCHCIAQRTTAGAYNQCLGIMGTTSVKKTTASGGLALNFVTVSGGSTSFSDADVSIKCEGTPP